MDNVFPPLDSTHHLSCHQLSGKVKLFRKQRISACFKSVVSSFDTQNPQCTLGLNKVVSDERLREKVFKAVFPFPDKKLLWTDGHVSPNIPFGCLDS